MGSIMIESIVAFLIATGVLFILRIIAGPSKEGYGSPNHSDRTDTPFPERFPKEASMIPDYESIRREILRKKMERAAPAPQVESAPYPLRPVLIEPVESKVEEPQIETVEMFDTDQNFKEVVEVNTVEATVTPAQALVKKIKKPSKTAVKKEAGELLRKRIRKSLTHKREVQAALITGEILSRPIALK